MWERTLQDLIRGIRANTSKPQPQFDAFLQAAIEEIRKELKGSDMDLKAGAVLKMVYLMMLYPVTPPPSFAFHVVEVMSSSKYHLKEVGYLAAEGAFPEGTEEVVLTVNGLKKDLLSPSPFLPQLALTGLSSIVTPPLARDLSHDISSLLTHSKPQVRKRAVLCMYKIFEKYPDSLQDNFSRLRDRLEDDDQGVVSATVNVLTELARKNAKNYLPLAPQLFEILSKSQNNWMLIKIVKLFALLTPHEPRLIRKLLPPITNLITTTPAVSLLYECVRTCITGGMLDDSEAGEALARVCVGKLSNFLEDEDQNLKYISLLALVNIIPTHAYLLEDYQDVILKSVDDPDLSIRLRALDLVCAMVNRRNVQPIIDQLVSALLPPTDAPALPSATAALLSISSVTQSHNATPSPTAPTSLLTPSYRAELASRILSIGFRDTFASISSFEWYLAVLVDLAYISRVDVGREIRRQLMDIVVRVKVESVRRRAVELMEGLLKDESFVEGAKSVEVGGEAGWGEILSGAAWIVGEFCEYLSSPTSSILQLLSPSIARLPSPAIAICLHSSVKIFAFWAASKAQAWNEDDAQGDLMELRSIVDKVIEGVEVFRGWVDAEVQERAINILQLFSFIRADLASFDPSKVASSSASPSGSRPSSPNANKTNPSHPKSLLLLPPLFTSHSLPPVSSRAQASVPLPQGLDLDTPLYAFPSSSLTEEADSSSEDDFDTVVDRGVIRLGGNGKGRGGREMTGEEEELRRVVAAAAAGGPGAKKKGEKGVPKKKKDETPEERVARKAAKGRALKEGEDVDSIPIIKLNLDDLPSSSSANLKSRRRLSASSSHPPSRTRTPRPASPPPPPQFEPDEMPEGYDPSSAALTQSSTSTSLASGGGKMSLRDVQLDLGGSSSTSGKDGKEGKRGKGKGKEKKVSPSTTTTRPKILGGGFEEYQDGDLDAPVEAEEVVTPALAAVPLPPVRLEVTPTVAPPPAAAMEGEGVMVTKVVKKKKKKKAGGE